MSSAIEAEPLRRALVLGANGMLGRMVAAVLDADDRFEIATSTRGGGGGALAFDVQASSIAELLDAAGCEWVVNAIGVLRRRIDEDDPASVGDAIDVNASFPHRLADAAAARGIRVIQIATDGVFSGADAPYDEEARHDAVDAYGRSKSLGEVAAPNVLNLRCSIIGPEPGPPTSVLGWALSQPRGARITGYANHRWNGITSLHFARLCAAAIVGGLDDLPSPLHVVPADGVSKAELLVACLRAFGRDDVTVSPRPAASPIDRTLSTNHPEANRHLWAAAGYPEPPTIATMVAELAAFGR